MSEYKEMAIGDTSPVDGPSGEPCELFRKIVRLVYVCVGYNEAGDNMVTCRWQEVSTGRLLTLQEIALEGGYIDSSV